MKQYTYLINNLKSDYKYLENLENEILEIKRHFSFYKYEDRWEIEKRISLLNTKEILNKFDKDYVCIDWDKRKEELEQEIKNISNI